MGRLVSAVYQLVAPNSEVLRDLAQQIHSLAVRLCI